MPNPSHQSTGTATSRRYPRYLSFSPGELETQIRELNKTQSAGRLEGTTLESVVLESLPLRQSLMASGAAMATINGTSNGRSSGRNRSKLLKSHSCSVRYPDGGQGCCHYTRIGPTWHLFRFDYVEAEEDEEIGTTSPVSPINTSTLLAIQLPPQFETKRLENDVASIELACREKAASAFRAAIERERREYFRRGTENNYRRKHPERFQMKALRAKALAGKYAVCQLIGPPTGKRLLPVGPAYERLDEANREWQVLQGSKPFLVVACCNRLDRCWEIPKFNPLYAVFDPRKDTTEVLTASTTSAPRPHSGDNSDDGDDWEYLPGPDGPDGGEENENDSEEGDDVL